MRIPSLLPSFSTAFYCWTIKIFGLATKPKLSKIKSVVVFPKSCGNIVFMVEFDVANGR